MSQVSGTEPTAVDTTTVAPPATQPAPESTPAAAETTLREDQVAIDKSMLAPFGNDTHEMLRLANEAKQAEIDMQMPLSRLMSAVMAPEDPTVPATGGTDGQEPATPQTAPPATEQPAPLTEEALMSVLDKREEVRAEADATQRDEADRASTEERVMQDKGRHFVDALKVIGVKPDDKGEWPKRTKKDQRLYEVCLDDAMRADIPVYAKNDDEEVEKLTYRTSPTTA